MKKNILFISIILCSSFSLFSQQIRVTDNKGTIQNVNNNRVFTQNTDPNPIPPASPITVEGDIWFDTANAIIKIWDGTWLNLVTTPILSNNFYNSNGTLTSARTVNRANNPLTFNNINGLSINSITANTFNAATATVFNSGTSTTITSAANNVFTSTAATQLRSTADIVEVFGLNGINLISNTNITGNLSVTGTYTDSSGDTGTNGQVLISTGTGTNWINNPANSNWLTTGNTGTTNANFLGTTDDRRMQIRSNNVTMLEFGRRQTLGLTQNFPDYTDNNQSLIHVRGNGGVSALQFEASGASFYRPMFFTTANGSFRLKGSSGRTDLFEIGSAGPNNDGRLEFIVGDDGTEPIVFKRFHYNNTSAIADDFYREFFRVQGANNSPNAKTRFGININQDTYLVNTNITTNSNGGTTNKVIANSTFQVEGSVSKSIVRSATNFTLTEDHYTLIATDIINTRTINLPSPVGIQGRIYIIKTNINRGVNLNLSYILTNGSISPLFIPNQRVVQLQSDGLFWQQIN